MVTALQVQKYYQAICVPKITAEPTTFLPCSLTNRMEYNGGYCGCITVSSTTCSRSMADLFTGPLLSPQVSGSQSTCKLQYSSTAIYMQLGRAWVSPTWWVVHGNLMSFMDSTFNCRAISHFWLLFCEFLRHSLIQKLFTNTHVLSEKEWTAVPPRWQQQGWRPLVDLQWLEW